MNTVTSSCHRRPCFASDVRTGGPIDPRPPSPSRPEQGATPHRPMVPAAVKAVPASSSNSITECQRNRLATIERPARTPPPPPVAAPRDNGGLTSAGGGGDGGKKGRNGGPPAFQAGDPDGGMLDVAKNAREAVVSLAVDLTTQVRGGGADDGLIGRVRKRRGTI